MRLTHYKVNVWIISRNQTAMQNVTIRLHEELIDRLDDEADNKGVSRSEYVRHILEDRHRVDELEEQVAALQDGVESREARIRELEEQLKQRSQIEEKVDVLAERVEDSQLTYVERRQRMIDRASLAERLHWKVTGVPIEERDDSAVEE